MNARQCRMARAILGISIPQLATLAKVSQDEILRLERDEQLDKTLLEAVCDALESSNLVHIRGEKSCRVELTGEKLTAEAAKWRASVRLSV